MLTWTTEKRKVSDLIPAQYNPRELTEDQASQLSTSLERFNLADPIVINTDNTIIGGHQRINIYKLHNKHEVEVDCRIPSRKLTPEEEKELNLRLNKNLGQWDYDLLANFDEDMLKDVGFDSKELDKIFQLDSKPEDDDVPEVRETSVKTGDIYTLGEHRLMCGDSTKKEDVERLMAGEKADMVFTDPPYGINLDTDYTYMQGLHKAGQYSKVIGDDKDFDPTFILETFSCEEILLWGGDYYAKFLPQGSWVVWDKREDENKDRMMGSAFELCWSKNKHKREIIRNKWAGHIGLDTKKRLHPTQKPIAVCEWVIERYSERDNKIIDIYGGSGSTLIACEKLNRKCRMMEIDPIYCQVIIDRWEKYTDKKAEKCPQ